MNDPLAYDPEDAYYGVLGEIAHRHRDQIPLNLLALYAMLLPAIGSLIGRRAVITVSRDRHYTNLFTAIVGSTGKGKGTCWNIVEYLLKEIDPTSKDRLHCDAASAQGLIRLVRDASTHVQRGKEIKDPGVTDKRCLMVFEEMDTLFVAMSRQGSTLAPVWNMAYDGKTLDNNTKEVSERATDPHISAVCHITEDSFQQAVANVSKGLGVSNGLFNRFITVHAHRDPSRKLPRGGEMPDVSDLAENIRDTLKGLGTTNDAVKIDWHALTHAEWAEFVDAVDSDHPFLAGLGGLAARLKPAVMRVAMLFAILDRATEIMPCHLKAAKSFCLQCIDSSRDLFGGSSNQGRPNTLRQRVLQVIDHQPKTLTQLHDCLHRKGYSAAELRQLLADLTAEGLLEESCIQTEQGKSIPAWSLPGQPLVREKPHSDDRPLRMMCGAELRLTRDTHAIFADGSSQRLAEGQAAHIARIPADATATDRTEFHRLIDLKPAGMCIIVRSEPMMVDRHAVQMNTLASG